MRRVVLLIAVLAVSATPAAARVGGADVIRDCTAHGHLTHRFKAGEYRAALRSLPADEREYGNCYDVIQRAEIQAIGHATGEPGAGGQRPSGPSSSSGGLPTPLLVLLILLAAGAVAGAVVVVRARALRDRGT